MASFIYRTEDFDTENILEYWVETDQDRSIINQLKAPSPIVLEGSRGTGKSFLMRVAEAEMMRDLGRDKVFPVYVSFAKSSLIHTSDPNQFRNWMLSRICVRTVRSLRKAGYLTPPAGAVRVLSGERRNITEDTPLKMEDIAVQYEESWRNPGVFVKNAEVPDVEDFRDALEDICDETGIRRFCFLFDEVAHIFRPEQQRQFFTLFRDLRSSVITCNAAVYPGLTSYGPTFQLSHDATLRRVERDVLDKGYLESMWEIVQKQADSALLSAIESHKANFHVLCFAASGNPRILLKTVALCPRMRANDVNEAIKQYYRVQIWADHSSLGNNYTGHRHLVDWGRDFIEKEVVPATKAKNESPTGGRRTEKTTCYFWIHRDAPVVVSEAMRLLAYTGIVQKGDETIRASRAELGTRYSLNLGCILAEYATPVTVGLELARELSIKRFTEYGHNHSAYQPLLTWKDAYSESNVEELLGTRLLMSIDYLDITAWQRSKLTEYGIRTVGELLRTSEENLQEEIDRFGPKRSRKVMNAAMAAVLEYLSA